MAEQRPYRVPGAGAARLQQVKKYAAVTLGLAFIIVNWMSTQHAARLMGDSPQLGQGLFSLPWLGLVYAPWKWMGWAWQWRSVERMQPLWMLSIHEVLYPMAPLTAIAVAAIAVLRQGWFASIADLHASARWANTQDVRKTGFLETRTWLGRRLRRLAERLKLLGREPIKAGIFLASWRYFGFSWALRDRGESHVLVFAPSRSGKGASIVVPTLMSWPHSVIVHDVKQENWAITAGWRKRAGHICLKFDPTDGSGASVRFNPLEEVRLRTEYESEDVENIVHMMVDPRGKGLDDHWLRTGVPLLTGTILHVLYCEPNKTLRGVAGLLSDPSATMDEVLERMLTADHDPGGAMGWHDFRGNPTRTHPLIAEAIREVMNKNEKERSSVISSALTFLSLYRNPVVAANTARSDFRIHDLMNHERPVSLYISIPLSSRDRLRPLLRLMLNQIVRHFTRTMIYRDGRAVANYKHPLLLMLDEFPTLGRLEILAESLSLIAGYGLRACLVAQDITQIHEAYGHDESITSNCNTRVAFTPNKMESARWISAMVGETTVRHSHRTVTGSGVSTSESEIKRPMMTPDEVMVMDEDAALIFTRGHPTIRATRIRHFNQPLFSRRTKIPPPAQSDRILRGSDKQQEQAPGPPGAEIRQLPHSPEKPQQTDVNGNGGAGRLHEQRVRFLKTRTTAANGKATDDGQTPSKKAVKLL